MQQVNKSAMTSGTTEFKEKLKAEKEVERLRQLILDALEEMSRISEEQKYPTWWAFLPVYEQLQKGLNPEAG